MRRHSAGVFQKHASRPLLSACGHAAAFLRLGVWDSRPRLSACCTGQRDDRRGRLSHTFFAALVLTALLLPTFVCHAEEEMATRPEECLFFGNPDHHGVNYVPEDNVFLLANQSGIRSFDVPSGAQRWHHIFKSKDIMINWGRKHILAWAWEDRRLFLLDKTNGREVWTSSDVQYGSMFTLWFVLDETRAMVAYMEPQAHYVPNVNPKITYVLYDFASPRPRVFGQLKDATFAGSLSDGKSMVFFREKDKPAEPSATSDKRGLKEYFLLDTGSGAISEGHVIPDSDKCLWASVSPSGLLAVPRPQKGGPTGLKIFDVRTGAFVRDLGEVQETFICPSWADDETRLFFVGWETKRVGVIDAQTGAVLQTFSRPGHSLINVRIQQPSGGPDMILSQDEDRNYWSWPPTADATPVKLFDGRKIAPGDMVQLHNTGYVTAHQHIPGVDRLVACWLEGMQKTGEWRMAQTNVHEKDLFNRILTHCIHRVTTFSDDGKTSKESVEVYATGGDGPVFSGEGKPLALSPDGRFLVLQNEKKTAFLQDLEKKQIVCSFETKLDYGYEIEAAFSDDGRRVAVNVWPNLEVVDLASDFPRRKMAPEANQLGFQCVRGPWNYGEGNALCFSPDGTRLLSGSYGRAWLHDADTGVLLHTFIESERFLETHGGGQDRFLDSLAQSARDWAGMVTDRFKGMHPMYAMFGGSDDRVVTHVAGKIIRVWDSRSGELINTIETGLPERRNANGAINNQIVLSDNGDYAFAYNRDNFAPASLWSLADGTLIRKYKLPDGRFIEIALSSDAKSVYVLDNGDLYRWPGRPKDEAQHLPTLGAP